MSINVKMVKSAMQLFTRGNAANTVTKSANGAGIFKNTQGVKRLFSLKSNPNIGTEITNNLTGTRFFRDVALDTGNCYVAASARRINTDGTYQGIAREQFDKLLKAVKQADWNPILQSKEGIGKEFLQKGVNIRYFRPDKQPFIGNNYVTAIHDGGSYHSMSLKQFDDMVLNMLG